MPDKLFIPNKEAVANTPHELPRTFREIERWANRLSGGGGLYASLTGPGETTTPGDLTQSGGFTINTPASSTMGIEFDNFASPGILFHDFSGTGVAINADNVPAGNSGITLQGGGIYLHDTSGNNGTGIRLETGATAPIYSMARGGFIVNAPNLQYLGQAAVSVDGNGVFISNSGTGFAGSPTGQTANYAFYMRSYTGGSMMMHSDRTICLTSISSAYGSDNTNTIILNTAAQGIPSYPAHSSNAGIWIEDTIPAGSAHGGGVRISSNNFNISVNAPGVGLTASNGALSFTSLQGTGGSGGTTGTGIWFNRGNPSVVSPSTGGGIITIPSGSNNCQFCFDTAGGHIWVSDFTTGAWRQITS